MKLVKQAMTLFGTVLFVAMVTTLLAPKAVHAVVSTLVTVANTAANPVITQAGDNRARTAVALQCFATGAVGFQQADCSLGTAKAGAGAFQVPAGQRLVIEYVTGQLVVPVGSAPNQLMVNGEYTGPSSGPTSVFFPEQSLSFVPTQIGSDSRYNYYNFSAPLTGYLDPDYSLGGVCSLATPPGQGQIICTFDLFGHLENIN